jgi:hypothetical protein
MNDFEGLIDDALEDQYKEVKHPNRTQREKLRALIRDLDNEKKVHNETSQTG